MNSLERRTTYQYGTLMPELRKRGPNVWTYRFSERNNDKRVRSKVIVGTLDDLPTRADAERASEHLRLAANREVRFDRKTTMRGLVGRYVEEVLKPCLDVPLGGVQDESEQMSYWCAKSYLGILRRYVSPRWEEYHVIQFERPEVRAAVEQWLRSLLRSNRNPEGLAPTTVRSIFVVMKLVFKFAVKWAIWSRTRWPKNGSSFPGDGRSDSRNLCS